MGSGEQSARDCTSGFRRKRREMHFRMLCLPIDALLHTMILQDGILQMPVQGS